MDSELLGPPAPLLDSDQSPHSEQPLLQVPDVQLDLRGTPCPINFVKTKLRLEQMVPGSLLEVWLDPGEPMEQVPDSLRMEGYGIELLEERSGFFALQVRCPLGPPNHP